MRAIDSLRKLLWACIFISASVSATNHCSGYVTESAERVGDLRLCESRTSGGHEVYACLVFHDGDHHYQALFKGGVTPRLIEKANHGATKADHSPQLLWQKPQDKELEVCAMTAPKALPGSARHLGTGVCIDSRGASVPCSIYERTLADRSAVQRFFVYYHPWGEGVTNIDISLQYGSEIEKDDRNEQFLAELTRLIGEGLKNSTCCAEQAQVYLEFAESLVRE
ncbi:MAG: hypothetical protein OEY67_06625 [Gammaproteobacteria bacterium]|nr:hypothetical protein [Gammaproteobacteria bacterium]